MPIEIRELVIRSVIGQDGEPGSPEQPGGEGQAQGSAQAAVDVDALVQECVRQVMRVLERQRDR